VGHNRRRLLTIPGTITKDGKPRELPLIPELAEILEHLRAVRSVAANGVTTICLFIFHQGNGKFAPQFQRHWAKATKTAGCPDRLLYDLRRFLIHSNVPMQAAKKWSGHESDAVSTATGFSTRPTVSAKLPSSCASTGLRTPSRRRPRPSPSVDGQAAVSVNCHPGRDGSAGHFFR